MHMGWKKNLNTNTRLAREMGILGIFEETEIVKKKTEIEKYCDSARSQSMSGIQQERASAAQGIKLS